MALASKQVPDARTYYVKYLIFKTRVFMFLNVKWAYLLRQRTIIVFYLAIEALYKIKILPRYVSATRVGFTLA